MEYEKVGNFDMCWMNLEDIICVKRGTCKKTNTA